MDEEMFKAAMTANVALAMTLQHKGLMDVEEYVIRLMTASLLAGQGGQATQAQLLDAHIALLRKSLAQRGSGH